MSREMASESVSTHKKSGLDFWFEGKYPPSRPGRSMVAFWREPSPTAGRRDEPHSTVGDRSRVLAREHALVVEAAARGRVEPVSGPSGAYGRAAARPPGRCGVSPTSYWGGPASRWAYAAQSSSSSSGGGLAGVTWRGSVGSPIEARMARITSGSWISAISSNRPPQSHRRTSNPKAR